MLTKASLLISVFYTLAGSVVHSYLASSREFLHLGVYGVLQGKECIHLFLVAHTFVEGVASVD